MFAPWKESHDKPRRHTKKQRHHFANKCLSSQTCDFSSGHVWMGELDHKEGWVLKNWCFWTVGLEKTLESPLDCKEIKPVSSKGNQPWIFIEKTDAEAEAPILWPPGMKSWLIRKDPDAVAGKIEGKRRRGRQRMRLLDGITNSMDMSLSKLQETVENRGALHVAVHRIAKSWTPGQQQQQQYCYPPSKENGFLSAKKIPLILGGKLTVSATRLLDNTQGHFLGPLLSPNCVFVLLYWLPASTVNVVWCHSDSNPFIKATFALRSF